MDRSTHQSFKWYVTDKDSILKIIYYFKEYPSRSAKNSRLHLIPRFYELKSLKAHKAPEGSILDIYIIYIYVKINIYIYFYKSWTIFFNKWSNYDLDG